MKAKFVNKGISAFRLATDIRAFDPARKPFYRAVQVVKDRSGNDAEVSYKFEQGLVREFEIDETVMDESGQALTKKAKRKEDIVLNPDEFVADMWDKGVRFGLDIDAIREAI